MNWNDLRKKTDAMDASQLFMDVVVYCNGSDEFMPVSHFELCNDTEEDRLDDGHPYLVLKECIANADTE